MTAQSYLARAESRPKNVLPSLSLFGLSHFGESTTVPEVILKALLAYTLVCWQFSVSFACVLVVLLLCLCLFLLIANL